ncbi:tRNA pseudouridine synthase B [Candidatus Zixiibacteriota bacterium]|nr:tRNA pseudouridine synthase B [candidate division Zixibacteria bacterium]
MADYEGILLCNKPYGISSHDVMTGLKRILKQTRVGHTGTLDPRATGLLVVCLGRATKIVQFLSDLDKTYEAEITLGISSPTFDSEGVTNESLARAVPNMTAEALKNILSEFLGISKQRAPIYSAVKVKGQRLYDMARRGLTVVPPEREIEIKRIELLDVSMPRISFQVTCSKGTYIRSLANDIGEKIGCGAYLSRLIRTQVGNSDLKDALNPNEIKYNIEAGTLKRHLKPIESVLNFPAIEVYKEFAPAIISGKAPELKDVANILGDFNVNEYISLMDHMGRIMAVGKAGVDSGSLRRQDQRNFFTYVRVLN